MIINVIISILCFICGFLLFELLEKRKIDKLKRKLTEYYTSNQRLMMKIKRMSDTIENLKAAEKSGVN